jgi:uncharacterized repeat protein (TIGR01451 family)
MSLVRSIAVSAAALALGATAFEAHAAGTTAGTSIQNTAQVTYQVGGSTVTASSNTSTVTVAEILDVVVTIASATVASSAGAAQQELVFTITNTGNGDETFELIPLSAGVTGDDFDPELAAPSSIFFDTDNSGDLSAPDTAYIAGTNDPTLAADASVRVLVVNAIPAAAADGTRGRSQLTARARTGFGNPGTNFQVGGVDAVVGTTRAEATLFGEYQVQGFQLAAVKSQTISDQFGGSRPIPGARINYQIVVTPSGTGTALAAMFSDAIPANTTYVAGSLELNNGALTDTGGADDAGEYTTTPTPQVRVNLGDLTTASGPQTVEFAVTIN